MSISISPAFLSTGCVAFSKILIFSIRLAYTKTLKNKIVFNEIRLYNRLKENIY